MSWATIRPQLKTLLESISDIQEVSGTPKLSFNGYPSAIVVPSDQSGAYETTSENTRIYAFQVRLFYETKNTGVGEALEALEGLVDTVIDTIDQEDLSSTRIVGKNLPSKYIYIRMSATPSSWGELTNEDLIYADITVQVVVSVDIT